MTVNIMMSPCDIYNKKSGNDNNILDKGKQLYYENSNTMQDPATYMRKNILWK